MVKIKVFAIASRESCDDKYADTELSPLESFIEKIGYNNIRNIVTSSPNSSGISYYTFFYEDGLPYAPRQTPEKKGIFGF